MRTLLYALLSATIILAIMLSGCVGSPDDSSAETGVTGIEPASTEVQAPEDLSSGLVLIDPDSIAMETRFRYDDKTGRSYGTNQQDMNTIAVWLMKAQEKTDYYFTTTSNQGTGNLKRVLPGEGKKFIAVTVRASVLKGYAYSPPHWDFNLIDKDGIIYLVRNVLCEDYNGEKISLREGDESLVYEHNLAISNSYKIQDLAKIYVRLRLPYKEDDNQQAVIVFEVPKSFNRDYSYVTLDLAGAKPKWSLAPVHCSVSVTKDQYGMVKGIFQGGSGVESISSILMRLYKDDGTVGEVTIKPLINSEGEIDGTKGASERVQVIVNHYSGAQYLVFDKYLKSGTYA